MQTATHTATRRAFLTGFAATLPSTMVLSAEALAAAPDNTFALIAAHRAAYCDQIQALQAKEDLVQSVPKEVLATPRVVLGVYPSLTGQAPTQSMWATTAAEIDDHVDRLVEERSIIWPTGHMGPIREHFEAKRNEWKAELAEAQRVNKQRQDETGLTAVQNAETAATATAMESWDNLLSSRPTTLAGALAFTRYVIECQRRDRTDQENMKDQNEYAVRALVTLEASLSAAAA